MRVGTALRDSDGRSSPGLAHRLPTASIAPPPVAILRASRAISGGIVATRGVLPWRLSTDRQCVEWQQSRSPGNSTGVTLLALAQAARQPSTVAVRMKLWCHE